MDVSVSETIDQKTYLKKFRGVSAPLASLDPPMEVVTLKLCSELDKVWSGGHGLLVVTTHP